MDPKHFTFKEKDDISTFEIEFSGELKGLDDFSTDRFIKLVKKIRTDAESKLIYLNLHKVQFWDTEGMRQTILLAEEINIIIGDSRVFILAPRDGYLFKRAKEKYPDKIDKTVKWKTTSSGDLNK